MSKSIKSEISTAQKTCSHEFFSRSVKTVFVSTSFFCHHSQEEGTGSLRRRIVVTSLWITPETVGWSSRVDGLFGGTDTEYLIICRDYLGV